MPMEDLVALLIFGTFFGFSALEVLFPARPYPKQLLWRLRGLGFLVSMASIATVLPLLLPGAWLAEHRLLDGSALGVAGGTLVGFLVLSFVNYVWHRASHRFDLLWRGFHQLHHSAPRLDMSGSTLFHPLDLAVYVTLNTVVTTLVLGLLPEAAALTGFVAQFYAFFQHLNVKTPRFLGYVIQRPEGHFVHHQRDVHAFNYADFPLWDMLFGTFRNPREFGSGDVGFEAPAHSRYGAMLVFRDVSGDARREPATPASGAGAAVAAE